MGSSLHKWDKSCYPLAYYEPVCQNGITEPKRYNDFKKELPMTAKLDPTVIDQLREQHNLTNFEQVGQKLGRTSHTVRNWYRGQTLPSAQDLVKLQFLTGRPYGTMLVIRNSEHVA